MKTRLRALEPEDLELLYTIENDTSMWAVGSQTAPYSRYRLRDYIANSEADIYKDEQVRFVIEEEGVAVGLIDLFNFSPQHMRAELGLAILKSEQGRGLARQAIADIIMYARDIVRLQQIYAIVPESNDASLRMLEACEFERTAMLKNWLCRRDRFENAVVMQLFLNK